MPRKHTTSVNANMTAEQKAVTEQLAGAEAISAYLKRLVREDAERRGVEWPTHPGPGKYDRMDVMEIKKGNANWKVFWGQMPLPQDAKAIGTIKRKSGETGALIQLSSGQYVQGNAGSIRTLDKREVENWL